MSDVVRSHLVVHGHVQGVFFRDTCRRKADARGVAGWISNRPDGAVEAVFEGDPADIAALVEFCRSGPRGAEVSSVEESSEPPEGLSGFRIR
jgi:acylphosphatase